MRRTITILALCFALPLMLPGQNIRISDFKAAPGSGGPAGVVKDNDGRPCALLRMRTSETGWTFDAGLAGIVDVVKEDGWINVYVPATAQAISIAKPGRTPLRRWCFPVRLSEGATYTMMLSARNTQPASVAQRPAPRPAPKPAPKPALRMAPTPAPSPSIRPVKGGLCTHFIDAYGSLYVDDFGYTDIVSGGFKYTYLPGTVGPYASLAFGNGGACFLGAAYRLNNRYVASELDIQAFGGIGLVLGNMLAVEGGIRFAWRSDDDTSALDFGFGLQLSGVGVMPTVEVGLAIWGIPVCIGLGLCVIALGM